MPTMILKAGNSSDPILPPVNGNRIKTPQEVQDAVNELVWRHGSNCPSWASFAELCLEVGITPADATPSAIRHAEKYSAEKLRQGFRETNTNPQSKLKVVIQDDEEFDPSKVLPSTPAKIEEPETINQVQEEKIMHVHEKDARQLLVALGKPEAKVEAYTPKRLTEKLNALPQSLDGAEEPKGDDLTLLKRICNALKEGKEVVLANGKSTAKAESNGKANPDKKPVTKKEKKPSGKKREGSKISSGLDAAAKVLASSNKALNKSDLLAAIVKKGLWTPNPDAKTPADTIKAAIHTEINKKGKDSRFKMAGPGLFTAK